MKTMCHGSEAGEPRLGRVVMTAGIGLLLGACGSDPTDYASSNEPTAQGEALAIPRDHVRTPHGDVSRSCVHQVENGSTVDLDGTVWLDGKVVARHEACQQVTLPYTMWNEYTYEWASVHNGFNWFNYVGATWTVPNPPTPPYHNQLLYFFPALESWSSAYILLQPVLQWGSNGLFGGQYWVANPWAIINGHYNPPNPIVVYPGDTMAGIMQLVGVDGGGNQTWIIYVADTTRGTYSYLYANIGTSKMTRAEFAVMETDRVTSCADYPATNPVAFTGTQVYMPNTAWNNYWAPDVVPSGTVNPGLLPCPFWVEWGRRGPGYWWTNLYH